VKFRPAAVFCLFFVALAFTFELAWSADDASGPVMQKAEVMPSHAAGTATENRESFQVLPGYRVERLFTVPKEQMGSWVCLAVDDKGRLLASDEKEKGIYRITPAPLDGSGETKVERLNLPVSSAQGMLYAFGDLYLVVNTKRALPRDFGFQPDLDASIERKKQNASDMGLVSGLYRARDTNGDDQFDEFVRLRGLPGAGEHGPHAVKLSPDGKSLFVICGNYTNSPFDRKEIRRHPEYGGYLPTNWDEDMILPRQWDAGGHARNRYAPGGWIAETDRDGKSWKMFSIGYRNAYDMDFNAEGELFTYDSDMEWDMGTPWYRATRVVHATCGSELGWRSGTGNWPDYYVDSLPPILETGPGSPVGVVFGYGAIFPAKYQQTLFICDWTFGTVYAVHLEPNGSSYKAVKEEFLSRPALPLTDIVVGADGAMYFTVGGRDTQSELYRVSYVGNESTAAVQPGIGSDANAELRKLRRRLEAYHGQPIQDAAKADRAIADEIWPNLGHADRFLRYAARIALEFQPIELWQDRVFAERDPETLIVAAVAMARQGNASHLPKLLVALDRLDLRSLPEPQQLELLRAYELAFIRLGKPDDADRKTLVAKFDALYPAADDFLNRELCNLLVYLESPTVVTKTINLMQQDNAPSAQDKDLAGLLQRNDEYARPIRAMLGNQPDRQKIHYALALRNVKAGWTVDERRAYFAFLRAAANLSGGKSFAGFLRNIDREAFENASAEEQKQIVDAGLRPPFGSAELPKPNGPGRNWTLDQVLKLLETKLHERDFKNGKKMYAAARCIVCHRFAGEGASTGPDLTQLAGRFKPKDLTEAIVEPSKVISDQYQATVIVANGRTYTGRIVGEQKNKLTMLTNPEDGTQIATIDKNEIEAQEVSKVSLMPSDLLKPLNEDEVLDLMAYLLSRGDPDDPMFRGAAKRQASK
jgi:putative heme-binding domain-containing protein